MTEKNPGNNLEDNPENVEETIVLDEDIIDQNVPVDRGYAWVILAACLALMITVNGSGRAFGIFFVELLKEFNATSSLVSFVLGAQSLAYSLSVFLVLNCLTELTTHRRLVLIGAVLCTTTFILDSVSPSIGFLILAHIIQGIGIAFTFGPNIVIVGHYFKKYRCSANALASCGSSVGQFCLSLLFTYLISTYGVRGALLLQAGLMLHCLVFASLLRPTDFYRKHTLRKNFLLNLDSCPERRKDEAEANFSSSNSITITPAITLTPSIATKNCHNNNTTPATKHGGGEEKSGKYLSCQKHTFLPEDLLRCEIGHSNPELLSMLQAKGVVSINCELAKSCDLDSSAEHDTIHHQNKLPLMGDSMLGFGSMVSLQDMSRRSSHVKALLYMRKNSIISGTLAEPIPPPKVSKIATFRKLAKLVFSKIDLNLLRYKLFLVFLFAYNFGCCGSSIMHSYFPSHARDIGLSREQGMFILSLSGFADLSGRLLMSIIADRLCVQRCRFVSMVLVVNGATCCCVPLMPTFYLFAAYCILYGLGSGLFFASITSVLTDFIGLHKLAQGLGMGFLLHGISASLAYPLHGLLRDTFGSYTTGFVLNGVSLTASGILFWLAPYARKMDMKARKESPKAKG